jgi:high-affinity iron transporter
MLLNSVVIVLREVLEAVLLMSVLLASARFLKMSKRWAIFALIFGVVGAVLYGYFLGSVSDLFEGVGQEVCNAFLQFGMLGLIVAIVFQVPRRMDCLRGSSTNVAVLMVAIVAMAITREGSEIVVYVSGFWGMTEFLSAVALGSVIGACIGLSVGVLVYYLLLALPLRHAPATSVIALAIIAAGMSSQAIRLLIQADWMSSSGALWDSSHLLSEQSLLGQLAYALVGYEASPSAIEAATYLGSLLLVGLAYAAGRLRKVVEEDAIA